MMKITMTRTLTVATLLFLLSSASAQTQMLKGTFGSYTLLGCYHIKEGVRCDFDYAPSVTMRLNWSTNSFKTVTATGANITASKVAVAGSGWSTQPEGVSAYKNVNIKVSALFPLPANTATLRVLASESGHLEDVPVRNPSGQTSAPAASQGVNLAGNWNATLSNCRQINDREAVCTANLRR